MTDFHDELDSLNPETREARLFANLPQALSIAVMSCPGLKRHLGDNDLSAVVSREALQALPVLRKTDIIAAQQAAPPFGGFVPEDALAGTRVFMSPGPVWEPQVGGVDPWQAARSLHAAGIRRGDRVHNAFSYHLTPGGFILDEGARALGCTVFPAGVGNTDAQVEALAHMQASTYIGTPDYLKTLLERAASLGATLGLKKALVSGGALFPAMRQGYAEAGVSVLQAYATADLGVIAYESATLGKVNEGMLINENLIVEICKPGTGEPVGAGEVGEVVVTRCHENYPLVRFATGDLSSFIDEPSPCGRTAMRIAGWQGRADQRTKVRGMFIDPAQVQAIRQSHIEIDQLRLVVSRAADRDVMGLQVVTKPRNTTIDTATVRATLKRITGLDGDVETVSDLPNDGVVVEDQRDYTH